MKSFLSKKKHIQQHTNSKNKNTTKNIRKTKETKEEKSNFFFFLFSQISFCREYFRKQVEAAEQGNANAQYNVGWRYENGGGGCS